MDFAGICAYTLRAMRFAGVITALWVVIRCLRRRGKLHWKREVGYAIFVAYLAALVEIIALRGGASTTRTLQLIPLHTTTAQLYHGWWPFVYHTVGNLVWFVPLGIFLPWILSACQRFKGVRPWKRDGIVVAIGALLSALLEGLQWLLSTGMTDVDDVLLNALGTLLGVVIHWIICKIFANCN